MSQTAAKYRQLLDRSINRYINDNQSELHEVNGKKVIKIKKLYEYCSQRSEFYDINRANLHYHNIIPSDVISQKGHQVGDIADYELRLDRINAFIKWCEYKENKCFLSHGKKMQKWILIKYPNLFKTEGNVVSSLMHIGGVNDLEYLFFIKGLLPENVIPNQLDLNRYDIKRIIKNKAKILRKPSRPIDGASSEDEFKEKKEYVYLIKLNCGLYKFSESAEPYPNRIKAQYPESDDSFGHLVAFVDNSRAAEKELHKYLYSMEYRQPKQKYKDRFWLESDEISIKLFKMGLNSVWPQHELVVDKCPVKIGL